MGDTSDEQRGFRWRLNRDLLAALMSGFVGALALAVSTYNVYLQHKQVRAQVWPRLLLMPSLNSDGFTFDLENGGIGPAEIRTLRVFVDDKPVADWPEAISRMTGKDVKRGSWGWSTMHGTLATAGQKRRVFTVTDKSIGSIMFEQQSRLRAEICYCSALDDCWVLENNVPRAVSKCPAYGEEAFRD
jgi:hypothetical protein